MTERRISGDNTRKTPDAAAKRWYDTGTPVRYEGAGPGSYRPGGKMDGAQPLKGTELKHSGPNVHGTENKHSGPAMGGTQNQHSGPNVTGSENSTKAEFKE